MSTGPSIALSGAPGTGKTSIAEAAKSDGWAITSVQSLAEEHNLLGPIDSEEGAREIDIHALSSALGAIKGPLIIDGHLSHLLNVDAIAILRCEPSVLQTRLEQRSYPTWKVESNIEWELIGGTWAEVEIENVAEFDSSSINIDDLWNNIREWINSGHPRLEPFVDWMDD